MCSADIIDLGCVNQHFGTDNRARSYTLRAFYRDGDEMQRRYGLFVAAQ